MNRVYTTYSYYQADNVSSRRRLLSLSDHESPKKDDNGSSQSEKGQVVCNCNRSPETITCNGCGRSFVGRKRISCRKHTNTIHLMDFMFCVFCKKRLSE
ncbi:hypothetical protein OS493_023130 [Desmophyllum pertusum]|uniref:Uncharacterized protein n=1 Tax=Desmophyllum pertusum TaxID=174260 RepID=A0A9X0CQC8_9CNID|nr:hypothetical protein OS493_023130 [Desmophyllum pertusum]